MKKRNKMLVRKSSRERNEFNGRRDEWRIEMKGVCRICKVGAFLGVRFSIQQQWINYI